MAAPVLASAGPTALWYLTRSTGIVSLVLLTAVMVLGVLTTVGWTSERWPRFVSQAVHRNLSIFCVLLVGVHVVTTVTDGFAPIGFLDAVLPFRSPYRPLWLGLGALAFDLLVVVGLTSAVRQRLGYRTWKAVHWLSYASWPVAVLHGLGTGSDTSLGPVLLIDACCVAAVVAALAWRLAAGWPAHAGRRLAGGATTSAFVLALVGFVALGPLRAGWSRRAGTPASLLTTAGAAGAAAGATSGSAGGGTAPSAQKAPTGGASTGASASGGSAALPAVPFSAPVAGTLTTSRPDASNEVTVDIRGTLGGSSGAPFEIVLVGTPDGGGVAMKSGRVTLGGAAGPVVGLSGDRILADVDDAGTTVRVSFRLGIDQVTGAVQGSVRAGAAGTGEEGDG